MNWQGLGLGLAAFLVAFLVVPVFLGIAAGAIANMAYRQKEAHILRLHNMMCVARKTTKKEEAR